MPSGMKVCIKHVCVLNWSIVNKDCTRGYMLVITEFLPRIKCGGVHSKSMDNVF